MKTDYKARSASAPTDLAMLKTPPHSIEAEQSVLGGVMLKNDAWDEVSERLTEHDFYRTDHRLIFQAVAKLAEQSQPLDVITLSETLERDGVLEQAGGLAYLGELARSTPSASNIAAYADIVRERSVVRQLIGVAQEIADAGFNPDGRSTNDLLDIAESKVFNIAENSTQKGDGPQGIKKILASTIDKIDELFNTEGSITGASTGFTDLDELTSGLQKGDLVIVAGRPSMGKTTFAMNLAENVAMGQDAPILIFSLEMPAEQLAMRMLSSLGRIDQSKIRAGQLEDDDWPRLTSTVAMLSERKVYIDDQGGLSPNEMRARARRVARENGGQIGLIVVDYMQLMSVPGMNENRTAEISLISRSLKGLARELECPLVALSQLNRSLEQRADKRPVMSDLRESGAIEQDADVIMFVYRDEVYNPETAERGKAEIIIGKQRNGPIGSVPLTFQGRFTRFDDYAHDIYDGQ
ncbi:replicative DNA helicase [Pelagibaculum spongiae]|uniref:Replicative DNA helicase n=1 Tax=Pelagibaculum spongiae TaxID=2080658 RepID=A0A2V1H3G1_9GAMM|nr:replicative DNA helicase [Pelagibaculum spongiae]PVZ70549.1 replicative DNA helicase [Pelagibaculum spongiae]